MTYNPRIAHSGAGVGAKVLEAAYGLPTKTTATTGKRDGNATTADLTRATLARMGADGTA